MSNWETAPLGSLCRDMTVGHVGKMSDQYVETGVPFLRSQDINPGWIDLSTIKYVSKEFHTRLRKSVLRPGDVVIVRTGYPGTAAVVPRDLVEANCSDLVIVRPGPGLHSGFLAYVLNSPWGASVIQGRLVGAAQQHFNVKVARALIIPVPPLPDQCRIAEILGAYDDLIEVNRRRVVLLEEMARGLFEEWFVRLRFPGHAEAEAIDEGLAGWQRRAIVDVCAMVRGRSYRSAELAESGAMPFVNLKCMLRDGGFKASGMKRYSGPFKAQHVVSRGDMVMAVTDMTQERRIVGRVARIPLLAEPESVISMDLVKVVPAPQVNPAFLYAWLRYSDFGVTAAQHANGANVLHLSPSAVADFPILVPPLEIQEAFGQQVASLIELAETLAMTEKTLAAARDLLLPRLISGQLSVAQAELELAQAA